MKDFKRRTGAKIRRINSHFCPSICNSLINVYLKYENTKFNHVKSTKNISGH